jgi:CD63 antigen
MDKGFPAHQQLYLTSALKFSFKMANCCYSMLKYIVFLFNLLFFITGGLLISIGAYAQIKLKNYFDFLGSPYLNSSIIFIIIGCVILVLAFFGCCGACTENACMLYTYATLMALILLVEIGLAVTIYVFRGNARKFVSLGMVQGMQNYPINKQDSHVGVKETWDTMESDLKCCGVKSYLDWKATNFGKTGNVPDSCCKVFTDNCGQGILNLNNKTAANTVYTEGCFTKFESLVLSNVGPMAGIGVGVAVFQVLVVIVSCFLATNMRRKDNYI